MSDKTIHDLGKGTTLQKMLSIRVAVWLVTRVGFVITGKGNKDEDNMISKK